MNYNEYNKNLIKKALKILGKIRLYEFLNKENKDRFIESYVKLNYIVEEMEND